MARLGVLVACCIEVCTNSIGSPALQPFTACIACLPAALVQPWPLAKIAVCLSLRGSKHAPVARPCTWRTTVSSNGLGPRLPGGHVARHCRQWCTWRRWRRQQTPLCRPRCSPLAVMCELSAAAPAADLWTATRRPLAVSRQAERGRRSGPPQLHRAGEAAEAEVDAEDLVMRQAKATVMQGAKATARATARQSSWPGPFWDWAVSTGRFFLAIEPFLRCSCEDCLCSHKHWRQTTAAVARLQHAQHCHACASVDPCEKCRGFQLLG